jgi:hypothetical protein
VLESDLEEIVKDAVDPVAVLDALKIAVDLFPVTYLSVKAVPVLERIETNRLLQVTSKVLSCSSIGMEVVDPAHSRENDTAPPLDDPSARLTADVLVLKTGRYTRLGSAAEISRLVFAREAFVSASKIGVKIEMLSVPTGIPWVLMRV